jgi:small subunit ribosomal protein S6
MALPRQCRNITEAINTGFLLARSHRLWAYPNPQGGFLLRTYEIVFIAAPNTTDDDLTKLTAQLDKVVTDLGGTITKTDNWGRKKLAYKIGKHDEGLYIVLYIEGSGKEIAEVERRLRVNDLVIRHMTVRTDEDIKRAAKLKARRRVSVKAAAASGVGNESGADDEDGDDEFDS